MGFLKFCLGGVSKRFKAFAVLNLLFFGCVFVVVLLAQFLFPPPFCSVWSLMVPEVFLGNWLTMVLGVFAFNLVLSAFVVVTLPGFVFFPLSAAALLYRAVLWGLLLYMTPTWLFLVALPTLLLEGEAYVVAAAAGTIAGFSWIKPKRPHGEETLSRGEAFRKGLKECLGLYVLVAALLFVAAVVETATLVLAA